MPVDTTCRSCLIWLCPHVYASRWSIFFQLNQFLIARNTSDGKFVLSSMSSTILDIPNNSYPRWQTHQIFLYGGTTDSTEMHHGNNESTASYILMLILVLFAFHGTFPSS